MIIRLIASSRSVQIDDPGNFGGFSVRIEGPIDPAVLTELLGRVAVCHDHEHAWISEVGSIRPANRSVPISNTRRSDRRQRNDQGRAGIAGLKSCRLDHET